MSYSQKLPIDLLCLSQQRSAQPSKLFSTPSIYNSLTNLGGGVTNGGKKCHILTIIIDSDENGSLVKSKKNV